MCLFEILYNFPVHFRGTSHPPDQPTMRISSESIQSKLLFTGPCVLRDISELILGTYKPNATVTFFSELIFQFGVIVAFI